VVAVSSRALFNLEWEARVYDRLGPDVFREHQIASENDTLEPGTAFALVKGLLALNAGAGGRVVEVIVVSRNDPDIGLRVTKSIEAHRLDITRIAYIGSDGIVPYLHAYKSDLFLSCNDGDVQASIDAGLAAAELYGPPRSNEREMVELRIAFDADAVLFSEESQHIYNTQGLEAFLAHEAANANNMLAEGPLARLLMRLGALQRARGKENTPVRLAIVTARNTPAHERVIKTLRTWGVTVDQAFFLGGIAKVEILKAFGAHIFFDDQLEHLSLAAHDVPCALVPYRTDSILRRVAEPAPDSAP
jgi:5'-nucleotidase